jgi:hypothetical protein
MHVFTAPPKKRVVIVINPKSESSNTFQQCTYAMERCGFFMHRKKGPERASKSSHHSIRAPPILTNNTTLNRRKCEDLKSNHGFCVERQFSVLLFLVMKCDGLKHGFSTTEPGSSSSILRTRKYVHGVQS